MDITIQSLFNHKPIQAPQVRKGTLVSTTKIGVEVEMENVTNPPRISGWRAERDGSLRNRGIEYVFDGPIGGSSACTRLKNLDKFLPTDKTFGPRTSVHIHVDVRDLTWKQTCDMVILYAMAEPYLFEICGKSRDESIYSLAIYRGQKQIENLITILERGPLRVNENYCTKYSAINLLALRDFGSLEFRGHHGSSDPDVLVNWINHLLKIKMYVQDTSRCPSDLPIIMRDKGVTQLLLELFGEELLSENIESAIAAEDLMMVGVSIAEELMHDSKFKKVDKEVKEELHSQDLNQMNKLRSKLCAD